VTLSRILQLLVGSEFSKYHQIIQGMTQPIVNACLDFLEQCQGTMLPIPSKLHYIFSLRNIVRVIKGMAMVTVHEANNESVLIRLWYHEMQREFYDRFNTESD
jgi:hypothetical protein